MVWFNGSDARCIETDLYEPCVGVRGIVEKLHGRLVASQKYRVVRVMLLCLQARSEVIQSCLRDDPGVTCKMKKSKGYAPTVKKLSNTSDKVNDDE